MKSDRKKAIIDIVSKYEVDTQETLQALLLDKGFTVTQATISRDVKELGLFKTMGINGSYKYALPHKTIESTARTSFSAIFQDSAVSVDRAMNIVVVKCFTGMANAVCSKLDTAGYQEIVGTIAGDDTIFLLMRSEEDAERRLETLKRLM